MAIDSSSKKYTFSCKMWVPWSPYHVRILSAQVGFWASKQPTTIGDATRGALQREPARPPKTPLAILSRISGPLLPLAEMSPTLQPLQKVLSTPAAPKAESVRSPPP